jgi:hypothetical protein
MNIHELDSYNLGDAVRFHRRLNPRIWGRDEHLLPEVREKLLTIAADFQEFLGVDDLNVEDITISGSNAAYSYTKNSDIDLHLVVTMPDNPVYQELFTAKKYQYNDEHNIKIGGADVELYVQPADQAHHSQGIYSIKNNDWKQIPQRKRARVDDACVRDKVADLDSRIHTAVKSKNTETISTLWDKIKAMRKSGLEQHGEFGCENIAFKMLRNSGCIKLLKDAMMAAQDRELSLREAPKKSFRYGFGEGMQSQPYSTSDGVAASTKQFLEDSTDNNIVQDFIQHVTTELGIDPVPEIHLHTDPEWSENNHSFGRYDPESHTLNVSMPNRHVMDVLRTVAHELVHCSQNQQQGGLPDDAGETGSRWENDANARAGVIMRDWANSHPEHFGHDSLEEGASGYIPKNKKEAAMPQYAMALSVDIKPGQVGKEANKLALNTGRNGEPSLLMKTANLREYKMPQPSQGPGQYRDLNEPLGPETPPKMPAGTVKVDVSDTQDWYQLGQDISNLDIANKAHYNQGPPHTVLAFGSEDLEHMYIQQLKRLGLNTHDLDEPGEDDLDEGINEGNQLTLRDFVVTVSPHALSQAHNKGVDVHMVDDILRNISKVKDNIMSLEPGRALILHNGQGTGLGVRRGQGNNLTLATVFPTSPGFRKGKHPTFQVGTDSGIDEGVAEGSLNESAVFLNPTTVVVGQAHGQPLELSPDTLKKIQDIAAKHGAWYEGNGTDRSYTKGQIDRYVGSWDDEVAKSASPNDPKWLYVLFANVDENNRVQRVGVDPKDTIFNRLLAGAQDNSFQGIGYTAQALQKFLQMASEGKYDFVKMSQQPATQENLTRFLKAGEALMWPSNWEQYPNRAGKIAKAATVDVRDQYLATRKAGVYVTGSGHLKAVQNITGQQGVAENFADGKNPGRKGLAKRVGVNTKASVSDLRKTAKNSSGEKQRMSHWLANMKAGRAKAKRK